MTVTALSFRCWALTVCPGARLAYQNDVRGLRYRRDDRDTSAKWEKIKGDYDGGRRGLHQRPEDFSAAGIAPLSVCASAIVFWKLRSFTISRQVGVFGSQHLLICH
jgi:hypothetical protein